MTIAGTALEEAALAGFAEVWTHKQLTERNRFIGSNSPLEVAAVVVRSLASAQGNNRGNVYAGSHGDTRYLIAHGDYGWVAVLSDFNNPPITHMSRTYLDCKWGEGMLDEIRELVRGVLTIGLSPYSVLQLFDSVYRVTHRKRVSPYFVMENNLAKLVANISPAVDACYVRGSTLLHLQD